MRNFAQCLTFTANLPSKGELGGSQGVDSFLVFQDRHVRGGFLLGKRCLEPSYGKSAPAAPGQQLHPLPAELQLSLSPASEQRGISVWGEHQRLLKQLLWQPSARVKAKATPLREGSAPTASADLWLKAAAGLQGWEKVLS